MTKIDQYSYVWDGSQPGWVLVRSARSASSLKALFGDGGVTVKNVQALRRTLPHFASMSAQAAIQSLFGLTAVELGTFEGREARRIVRALKSEGLTVQETGATEFGYLPFNELTKSALLIDEDTELASAVVQQALASGIPVRHVET